MKNVLKARGVTHLVFQLVALTAVFFFLNTRVVAQPTRLGDLDSDGQPTVLDLQRLLNQISGRDAFHGVP